MKGTKARSRDQWLDQFPQITNQVSAALMLRSLSGAEWEVLWDVWQHTSGHFDRRARAARTEYRATAEQIAGRCSHSVDHVRKAISHLVKQSILHRPVVGRHGACSVLAFNWDVSTWMPRDEVPARPRRSADRAHSRSGTTAYETGQKRPATAGQERPPMTDIAGQERPPFFKSNLRAGHKAPPPIDSSLRSESASSSDVGTPRLPEPADRETAAPCGLDGRVAAGRELGSPVDAMALPPRRRPPEDLDFMDLIRKTAAAQASRDHGLGERPSEGGVAAPRRRPPEHLDFEDLIRMVAARPDSRDDVQGGGPLLAEADAEADTVGELEVYGGPAGR